jgi:sulfoxide reductase heme-binding subunit YedZ
MGAKSAGFDRRFFRRLLIFFFSLLPLALLVWNTLHQQLGADPAKAIVLFTGNWAFYFLLLTLTVTPLRRLLGWNWLQTHRRMLGLFALFYALLHLLSYVMFILGADLGRFMAELVKRPYISVGFPALLILIVLGLTSTQAMMRRLGKRWQLLHRFIYLAVVLAWVHVLWQLRASYQDALILGVLTFSLLAIRFYWYNQKCRQ